MSNPQVRHSSFITVNFDRLFDKKKLKITHCILLLLGI